jgi:cell division protein FtsB
LYCFYRVPNPVLTQDRRRSPAKRATRSKRLVRWAVGFFAAAVLVDAVVGDRGLLAMFRARDQYEAAAAALGQLRADNVRMREEVRRLNDDPAALEELARGELGLMRPGEKLFIVKDLKPSAAH